MFLQTKGAYSSFARKRNNVTSHRLKSLGGDVEEGSTIPLAVI